MKIALITENSQAAKNGVIHEALVAVAEPLGHQLFNYGMYTTEDKASLTYVMNGLLTVLQSVDRDLLRAATAGEKFAEHFYANARDEAIAGYIKGLSTATADAGHLEAAL